METREVTRRGGRPRCLVLVAGPPGSGKSSVAAIVAAGLQWPVVARDALKETLFEALGVGDRAWSRRLGTASWDLLLQVTGWMMATGGPFLLDNNFRGPDPALMDLAAAFGYSVRVLWCDAPPDVLAARFRARWESGRRHAGHRDGEVWPEVEAQLAAGAYSRAAWNGYSVLVLDTSRPLTALAADAWAWLEESGSGAPCPI